jgi:HEAT repeat protein
VDPEATFLKRFGDLVALLRNDPANDAAQDLALTAVGAAIAHGPIRIDAGVETSAVADELSLQARLRARHVDVIQVASDAVLSELLTLARALAHDTMPLPANPSIEVTTVPAIHREDPDPPPSPSTGPATRDRRAGESRAGERRAGNDRRCMVQPRWPGVERRRGADRRVVGERRIHIAKDIRAESARLYGQILRASAAAAWEEALYAALGLVRLAPRMPQPERRPLLIQARRIFRRPAVEALIDHAERDPAARVAATDVLCWLGPEAAEAMVDRLRASPVLGPRSFLLDALGRMPQAYPLVVPLLKGERAHEIRYGALLAAKLDRPEAAPLLTPHLDHPEADVRVTVVQALGNLHHAAVGDALRATLHHPCPATRSAAAAAIAAWRAGALGVLLGAALQTERDRLVWRALIEALGRIGSSSACAALGAVALTRRSLFRLRGYTRDQRLAAVATLAQVQTPAARATLRRLAREADADVRRQARGAVDNGHRTATSA